MGNSMDFTMNRRSIRGIMDNTHAVIENLSQGLTDTEYIIKAIKADDDELKDFLFTLGCYEGETVTIISILSDNYVINVKDARYSIDKELAEAIIL